MLTQNPKSSPLLSSAVSVPSPGSKIGAKLWSRLEIKNLRELMFPQQGPCVSIYLSTADWRVRLAGLVEQAQGRVQRMVGGDSAATVIKPLLSLVARLAAEENDASFLKHRSIAIFRSQGVTGFLFLRDSVEEQVIVADSFHLLPIIDFIQESHRYYVMALRPDRIRLYLGTPQAIELLTDSSAGPEHRVGKRGPVDVARFYFAINERLRKSGELGRAPLIVLGEAALVQEYLRSNSYPQIVSVEVKSDFDFDNAEGIRARVAQNLAHWYSEKERNAIEEFAKGREQRRAADQLQEIAKASVKGRVKTLIVAKGVHLWGLVNRTQGSVALPAVQSAPRTDDVLDDLAELVVARGGQVIALEREQMPTQSPVAAVYFW